MLRIETKAFLMPAPTSLSTVPVLLIGNTKGGTGKSTIATSISAALAETGRKIFLVDADIGQSTTQNWLEQRGKGRIAGCKAAPGDIETTIARAMEKGADMVVIDLRGRDDAILKLVAEQADFVLIPAQPSMPDLKETNRFIRIAKAAGVPWTVIITRVQRQNSARARDYIDQYAAMGKIAPVALGDRVDFQDAYLHGRGVSEYAPKSLAAHELNRLRDHVLDRIAEIAA